MSRSKAGIRFPFYSRTRKKDPDFQTLLDNEKGSYYTEGICEIHLIQIFLDNAYPGYCTKAIPQKLGNEFIIPVYKTPLN